MKEVQETDMLDKIRIMIDRSIPNSLSDIPIPHPQINNESSLSKHEIHKLWPIYYILFVIRIQRIQNW